MPYSLKAIMQLLAAIFWSGLWSFALFMLLFGILLRWWPGDRLMIVRLANYAMPWLLIVLIPALIVAAIDNRKWLLLVLILPTLFIVVSYAPLFLRKTQQENNDNTKFKVMSYNIWSHNSDMTAVAAVIRQENPDILLLQELRPDKFKQIKALLTGIFPLDDKNIQYDKSKYLATCSRYPLRSVPITNRNYSQKSIIDTPCGSVTVYNVHLLRTVLTRHHQWQKLHQQINSLLTDEIAKTPGAIIMGGDFNMTDQTETYREVCRSLKNAHHEVGRGFGFTFPSSSRKLKKRLTFPPMIRIDHIFYNNALTVYNADTLKNSGSSDHFPVIAEFTLARP